MKFSCEFNGIDYIIETSSGRETDSKFIFLLSSNEKKKLKKGLYEYSTIHIRASKDDLELEFEIQGVPLSKEDQEQMENLEDFFENQMTFSKVEHMFKLHDRDSDKTLWGDENE
jgi:hypothetical protein